MFSNRTRVVAAVVGGILIGSIGTPVARAQFAVIDAAAIAKLVDELATANNILISSQAIYRTAQSQYSAFLQNVKSLGSKSGWITAIRGIGVNSTRNTYGETAGMQAAMNNATGIASAWRVSSVSPGTLLGYLSRQTPGQSTHLSHLATVEMQDSAGQTSLQAIGDFRSTDAANQSAFTRLEQNVQDTSPDFNTEAAQLNLANAIALQHLKQQRANNVLQAALLEQQLAANKYQRDTTAAHLQGLGELNQTLTTSDNWRMDASRNTSARRWVVP